MKQAVKRVPDATQPQPTGAVHPEQLRAVARLLLNNGDITPAGARILNNIANGGKQDA